MSEVITSLQNAHIKLAASLKQKKYRDMHQVFIAEGTRLVEEVLKSDWEIKFAIYLDSVKNERILHLVDELKTRNCALYRVNQSIYDKVCETKGSQGILLVVKKHQYNLSDILKRAENPVVVVMDSVQDPGNVGTIIRTADAAGCSGVILTKGSADIFNGKTVRSAMGALFHVPIIEEVETEDLLQFVKKNSIRTYAAALDKTAKTYFSCDFAKPTAMIFGNEGNGVSDTLLIGASEKVFIPMQGDAESLNVATSAAIIIYESLRQRISRNC